MRWYLLGNLPGGLAVDLVRKVREGGRGIGQPVTRKVRARKDTVVGNAHPSKDEGQCHRNETADGRETGTGKGETAG